MSTMIKLRWLIFALWIASVIVLGCFMPDLQKLATEKGQPKIPKDYSSYIGSKLLSDMKDEDGGKQSAIIAVFTSDNALTDAQLKEIWQKVSDLKNNREELHILAIRSFFEEEDLKSEMLSDDGTTLIVQIDVDKTNTGIDEIRSGIMQQLESSKVKCYLTGGDLINSDMEATMHTGTRRTELFTYLLIFVILLLVFGSPVTPLVSLFSIGLTYNCSLSIIALLAERWNIPYASTTQTFLLLVLFGIGTDYNILLMMRFREELKDKLVNEAIVATYRTAGKTVLLSSLTVLVGFAALFLAGFSVYQAVSAVTIGVVVLLLELVTLLPFFMKVLGSRLFWPRRPGKGENANRLWEKVSSLSVRKPVLSLMMILIITVPVILIYQRNLSYDNLHEVNNSYDSVKAIDLCSDKFGPGKLFPVKVLIESSNPMDNNEALSQIDNISDEILKISGVKNIFSVTRPTGEKLENAYLNEQTSQLNDNLASIITGIDMLNSSISSGGDKLPDSADLAGIDINVLSRIKEGMNSIKKYISDLSADQSTNTFYLPEAQIHGDYQKALDTYMSKEYKITELSVYLSVDPYSEEAITVVQQIHNVVGSQLNTGTLEGSVYGLAGVSSQNRDLSLVSGTDLHRSKIIMLVGIAIVLICITRSALIPAYILSSLIISYYSAITIAQLIFKDLTKAGKLTWDVPFFAFIILIPLGVDYSIFLITRYREAKYSSHTLAVVKAASRTGTSIMSAVIILTANFAALYLSGITSFCELSTVVIIGLAEQAFLFMPVFLPACISRHEKAMGLIRRRLSITADVPDLQGNNSIEDNACK